MGRAYPVWARSARAVCVLDRDGLPYSKDVGTKTNIRPPKGLSLLGVANEFEAFGHFTTKVTSIPIPVNNYLPKMPQTYKKP